MNRRTFLGWLAALPALLLVKPSAPKPAAPAFTGGFGPLNPPKPGERSYWARRNPDGAVSGVYVDNGVDFIREHLYVAECHEAGDNVTLGEDDLWMKQPKGDGFVVWRKRGASDQAMLDHLFADAPNIKDLPL